MIWTSVPAAHIGLILLLKLCLKRKIHYPFNWIQLTEWSNYLNMNSRRLHLPNKLRKCGTFLWLRLWNLCFVSMKGSIFSSCMLQACNLTKLNSFINIFRCFAKSVSYLALSTTRNSFFNKYLLPSGHTTSLQCHKTSIRLCPPVNVVLMLI